MSHSKNEPKLSCNNGHGNFLHRIDCCRHLNKLQKTLLVYDFGLSRREGQRNLLEEAHHLQSHLPSLKILNFVLTSKLLCLLWKCENVLFTKMIHWPIKKLLAKITNQSESKKSQNVNKSKKQQFLQKWHFLLQINCVHLQRISNQVMPQDSS